MTTPIAERAAVQSAARAAAPFRHRPVTRRRSGRPPPAAAVPVWPPTRESRFSPTSPRVRPGPRRPLPGRPAARDSPATLGMRPLG
jgi:hypothetical protein